MLVDQKQGADAGGGFAQQLLQPGEQHVDADDAHQHLILHDGL